MSEQPSISPVSKNFIINKPEKRITAVITCREAHLLKELRKSSYGQFIIFKTNGLIIRVEAKESKLIKEEEGLELDNF